MKAIHLKAIRAGEWSAAAIEAALSRLIGVVRVAVLKSDGIVSVLFDETIASAEQILSAARAAGLEARVLRL
jgi:hypothetical protein